MAFGYGAPGVPRPILFQIKDYLQNQPQRLLLQQRQTDFVTEKNIQPVVSLQNHFELY